MPEDTRTVSPFTAALIPAWMVGCCVGTWITAAKTEVAANMGTAVKTETVAKTTAAVKIPVKKRTEKKILFRYMFFKDKGPLEAACILE